jgi:hypothetical protein
MVMTLLPHRADARRCFRARLLIATGVIGWVHDRRGLRRQHPDRSGNRAEHGEAAHQESHEDDGYNDERHPLPVDGSGTCGADPPPKLALVLGASLRTR